MNHFRSRRFLAVAVAVASMFVASCAAAPAPTDIHPSNPITFTGIGGVYPGQTAAKAASFGFPTPSGGDTDPSSTCRTSRHNTYRDVSVILDGPSSTKLTVAAMYVRDPQFATSSGMKVGTSLTALKRQYGSSLGVFSPNWSANYTLGGHPVQALYSKVAVVINSNTWGLTYYLDSTDKVQVIKISKVNWLGDDEGCV